MVGVKVRAKTGGGLTVRHGGEAASLLFFLSSHTARRRDSTFSVPPSKPSRDNLHTNRPQEHPKIMYLKRPGGVKKPCSLPLTKRPMPVKIKVQRVPFMEGLSVGLGKKFQRPVMKRRAYGKQQDEALKRSSLGVKRRMNGMANLLRRSGKGLCYKAPQRAKLHADGESDTEGSSDEEEKEEDRPFEPLCVWNSPHLEDEDGNPFEAIGLPPRLSEITRPDEYGVDETIKVMQPAPKEAYSKQHVFVPPVLAKWLRPQYVLFGMKRAECLSLTDHFTHPFLSLRQPTGGCQIHVRLCHGIERIQGEWMHLGR